MAEEQHGSGPLQRRHAAEQPALRILVEIDDHVATEDHVQRATHRQWLDQVQLPEGDHLRKFRLHLVARCRGVTAAAEILAEQRTRHVAHAFLGIDAGLGVLQHVGIEVGRENADVPALPVRNRLRNRHRDGIRFLAGRSRRAPDADAAARLRIGHARRQHMVTQVFEVVVLAEECGEVGGHRIDEFTDLGRTIRSGQQRAILGERGEVELAQASRHASIHELTLAVGEVDAGELARERPQRLEIRVGEAEFPLPG